MITPEGGPTYLNKLSYAPSIPPLQPFAKMPPPYQTDPYQLPYLPAAKVNPPYQVSPPIFPQKVHPAMMYANWLKRQRPGPFQ